MDTSLRGRPGRVAIVTGGSRGVGGATTLRLAFSGYAVVVDYAHDQRGAESIVDLVLAENGSAVAVRADVTDELDVERLFAETIELLGGVDVVVHGAGSRAAPGPMAEADVDEFDALCRMNTRATFLVNREAARHLRPGGAIVNLTSSVVASAQPAQGAFAAARAATDALTRVLSLELRERDITVNAVSIDANRPCVPGRAADLVAYLLGDAGHRLTGRVIRADEPTPV